MHTCGDRCTGKRWRIHITTNCTACLPCQLEPCSFVTVQIDTSVMVWSTHTHTHTPNNQQPTSCEVFRSIGTLQHRDCADGFTCYVGRYDARTNTNCMPGFELWPCVTPCDLRYCKCVQAYSLWWRIHTRLCSCRAFLEGTTLTLLLLSPAMSKRNPGFVKCSSTAGI